MDTIGERINYLREIRNIKQKELAEAIGVTKATMSKYENNINIPNADILCKIADALNTSTDFLVGRTSDIKVHKNYSTDEFTTKDIMKIITKLNKENQIRIFERALLLYDIQNT